MALFTGTLSATIAFALKAAAAIAFNFAISLIAIALQKKPKSQSSALDFEQTLQRRLGTGEALRILTGRRIVAGTAYYDDSFGTNREYAVNVTVMSAKPCNAFHQLYLSGEPVTLNGDPTTGERGVTSHFLGKDDAIRVWCRVFLGSDNSGLGAYLNGMFPNQFSASDNFGDYCVMVTIFQNTDDDFDTSTGENFIPFQGIPEVRAEFSGAKICDPRISGYDYADESTYVYSDNAALIDAQFDYGFHSGTGAGRALIVGHGYPLAALDIDQIVSNANYCDTEGFSCAGVLTSGQTDDQQEIWKCYNADRVEHSAKIYSVPEGNRDDPVTIDMDQHLAAHVSFFDEHGYSTEVYNEVLTKYAEPTEYYAEVELDIFTDSAWVASDDHIPRQMELLLLFVTDKAQAYKLQKQEIYISRTPSTCTISDLPFNYISTKVGATVIINNSDVSYVNGKTWIVKGRSQTARGDVSLILRELAPNEAFAYDSNTEIVDPPVVTPLVRDWGTGAWPGTRPHVDATGVLALQDDVSSIQDGAYPLTDVLIEGVGSLVTNIDRTDSDIESLFDETAPTGGITLTLSATSAVGTNQSVNTATVTTNTITVTASGGDGSTIAYTWSKVSGDTFTIGDDDSNSTSFSIALTSGQNATGQYKVTVADNTYSVERLVTVYAENINPNLGGGGIDP